MKTLELELQKRLLIVEYPDHIIEKCGLLEYAAKALYSHKLQNDLDKLIGEKVERDYEIICKGDELTEGVAKDLVHSMNFGTDKNPDIGYLHSIKDNYWASSARESFISAIEAKGYYWGENPLGIEPDDIPDLGEFTVMMRKKHKSWKEAESRTFNPSKTLISKIL